MDFDEEEQDSHDGAGWGFNLGYFYTHVGEGASARDDDDDDGDYQDEGDGDEIEEDEDEDEDESEEYHGAFRLNPIRTSPRARDVELGTDVDEVDGDQDTEVEMGATEGPSNNGGETRTGRHFIKSAGLDSPYSGASTKEAGGST